MAYSESLARRVRSILGVRAGIVEKKMFGGVGFLHRGNMAVGIWRESLIARLGADGATAARQLPHVVDFDITGRPMKGWVMVLPEGVDDDRDLADWIAKTLEFVETLPSK